MRQSQLFTKTRKEAPSDEVAKNAELLIRAGYIHKEMAGVYDFLPLGLRVLNNIVRIIREEMDALGAAELFMAALQDPEVWKASGRWSDEVVDNWFKTKVKNGGDAGLGFTHEEPLVRIMTGHIHSYKDLPRLAYQFQTKFRNEARAKSGILRGREFLMKDLYSFARTAEEHHELYERVKAAYVRIFERLGIGEQTYITFASGGTFSKYSHEFQTVCEAGEDLIYVDDEKRLAVNREVLTDEVLRDLGLRRESAISSSRERASPSRSGSRTKMRAATKRRSRPVHTASGRRASWVPSSSSLPTKRASSGRRASRRSRCTSSQCSVQTEKK